MTEKRKLNVAGLAVQVMSYKQHNVENIRSCTSAKIKIKLTDDFAVIGPRQRS